MSASLVGSEMCIRDRAFAHQEGDHLAVDDLQRRPLEDRAGLQPRGLRGCLLYTSDAADDM
eukprot:3108200-Alexandrium_andersonii.AAC.1